MGLLSGLNPGNIAGGLAGMHLGVPGLLAGGYLGGKVYNAVVPGQEPQQPGPGMPGYPGLLQMNPADIDAKTNIGLNQAPFDKFTAEAMRSGPSQGALLANKQQGLLHRQAQGNIAGLAGGQAATARSQLAMRGGLEGGAAERIAKNANNSALDLSQGISNQAALNRGNIAMADEQNRIGLLAQAPGMELGRSGFELDKNKLNLAAKTGQMDKVNAYNMNNYNQQMQAWAANQQANATLNAGKKGGLLGMGMGIL